MMSPLSYAMFALMITATHSGSEFSGENVSIDNAPHVVEDCTRRPSATVVRIPRRQGAQATKQDDEESAQQFDLGCQVFDGTGLWLAPDGTECDYASAAEGGPAVDGECSSGFCVGNLHLSSALTYSTTDEPTNMLIAPTLPLEGTADRERVDGEVKISLAKLLTAAFSKLSLAASPPTGGGGGVEEDDLPALPAVSACDITITGIDSVGLSGDMPPLFYAMVDYTITVGPADGKTDHHRVAEALAAATAAIANPRTAGLPDDALAVNLRPDMAGVPQSMYPFAQFEDFGFALTGGTTLEAPADTGDGR